MEFDPTKLFGVPANEPEPEKLPTIRQFIKSTKKPNKSVRYPVETIWVPGEWTNYSLITNRFRVAIRETNNLFEPLGKFIASEAFKRSSIAVRIEDWENYEFTLTLESEGIGTWRSIVNGKGFSYAKNH